MHEVVRHELHSMDINRKLNPEDLVSKLLGGSVKRKKAVYVLMCRDRVSDNLSTTRHCRLEGG